MAKQLYEGWAFDFQRNVYMYVHQLTASLGRKKVTVPCEDAVDSEGCVLIWLYELKLSEPQREELLKGLTSWALAQGLRCRIYSSPQNFTAIEPTP